MSEAQQNVRLRLGPIASALIEGTSENRQEALDHAIHELREAAASREAEAGMPVDGEVTLGSLAAQIRQQTAIMSALRLQVLKEMQMLRVLVASLMSETDSGPQDFLAFATEAIGALRKETDLTKELERADLSSQEEAFHSAPRREMQHTSAIIEKDRDQEIER